MRILLVEDEPGVANFIAKGFSEQAWQVDVAYDGLMGKKLAEQNSYDLIVLDVILPHLNGIELCMEIRKSDRNVPIIMLSALGATDDVVTGLDVGADDYLTKPFKFKELLARVRALSRRRDGRESPLIYTIADLEVNTQTKTVTRSGQVIKLTPREYYLLICFLNNKGIVLSRADISENVWEDAFEAGSNIVDVYVNYLRNKIDKDFFPKLIQTVVGMGYVLKEEREA